MTTHQTNHAQQILAEGPPPGFQQPPVHATGKPAWYRRTWVLVAAGLLVGTGLGSASAEELDPTTTAAYKTVVSDRDQVRDDLASAETDLSEAQADLAQARVEIETIAGDLPDREAALARGQNKLEKAEASLADRQRALVKAETSVVARERKVGIVERTIKTNTVSGEGLYEVGVDIKAGTYKTAGRAGCYYAVLNSPDTFDIANNNNVDGPAVVSAFAGQYLMFSGCADWVWQG